MLILEESLKRAGYKILNMECFKDGVVDIKAQNEYYTWFLTDYTGRSNRGIDCVCGVKIFKDDEQYCGIHSDEEDKPVHCGAELYYKACNRSLKITPVSMNHDYMYHEIK